MHRFAQEKNMYHVATVLVARGEMYSLRYYMTSRPVGATRLPSAVCNVSLQSVCKLSSFLYQNRPGHSTQSRVVRYCRVVAVVRSSLVGATRLPQ